MTVFDHSFIFVIAIVYPIVSLVSYRRLLARVARGEKFVRTDAYKSTVISHWCLFALAMALWAVSDRNWADLGFGLTLDGAFFAAAILTIVGIVALYFQLRQVTGGDQATLQRFRDQIGDLDLFLPRNGNELGRFYGLSLTAGIVEEVLWRGFMIWYLSLFMPVWAAAVLSSIGFGIAHAYQGIRNMPQIAMVGGALALLFVLSGSVWLPMIMHTAIDMFQGRLAYEVVNLTDGNHTPSGNAPAAASA